MERRKAVTFAAVISGALLVGALAMTANAGILGAPNNDKVGHLSPVVATTLPTVIVVDDSVGTTAPPSTAAAATPVAPTVSLDDGGHGKDDGHDREQEVERDD